MSISSINSNYSNNQNVVNPSFDRNDTIEKIVYIASALEVVQEALNLDEKDKKILDEKDKKILNELLAIKAALQDGKHVSDQRLHDCEVQGVLNLDEKDKKILNELLAIKAAVQDGKRLHDCIDSFYMSELCSLYV